MIQVSSVVDVDAPAEIVFPYLSDPFRQSEWTPNFRELVQRPDGPPGLGTRYRGRLRVFGTVNFVIDQFDPGRMFRVDTDPPGARLTHRFIITPTAGGARVSHFVELEPRGPLRLASPLIGLLVKLMVVDLNRQMRNVLNELARAAPPAQERPSAGPGGHETT
jgi:uncharacterized protein YndB with AHSA1/START domain